MKFIKENCKTWLVFIISILVVFLSVGIAHGIQTGFGEIDVSLGTIETTYQTMDGKTKQGEAAL